MAVTLVDSPDLQVTRVTFTESEGALAEHAIIGRRFGVEYTVTNVSSGLVPDRQNQWSDYVFLSRDQFLDVRSDHFLGQIRHDGALAAGDFYSVETTFGVPRNLLGAYYVFVLTDVPNQTHPYGFVYEGASENNNAAASVSKQTGVVTPMTIDPAPPTDLMVTDITVPDEAECGASVTVTYTVKNDSASERATGYWADALYVSDDAVWDLGDKFLGRVEFEPDPNDPGELRPIYRDLAPGDSYTGTLTAVLPTVLPGDYRIIVRADIYDDINEGSENANNKMASSDTIDVAVDVLQLEVAFDDTLTVGGERLYEITVPSGETLEVSLTADDKTIANELYVRYEGLPNSITYDAAFEGHLWRRPDGLGAPDRSRQILHPGAQRRLAGRGTGSGSGRRTGHRRHYGDCASAALRHPCGEPGQRR